MPLPVAKRRCSARDSPTCSLSSRPMHRDSPTCSLSSRPMHHPTSLWSDDYSKKMLSGLKGLHQRDVLCDLTLKAGDVSINVHRVIMASISDYFCAMLTLDMKESRQDVIELKGVPSSGLQAVVQFVYSGTLKLDWDSVRDIMAAASHLQINEAMELCCAFLSHSITTSNCVDALNLAELYSLPMTITKAKRFILKNFELFAESVHQDQFMKLNCSQLATLLSDNGLKISSEFKLFKIMLKWISHDVISREQHLPELLSNVRLALLSGEELVEKVSSIPMIRNYSECVDLVTEAKDYHIMINKQPMLQTTRTCVRSETKSLVIVHGETMDSYNLTTRKRSPLHECNVPLYNPCVCVVNNFLYACGGKYDDIESNEIATARCFRYDPRFDIWSELASMNESRKDFTVLPIGDTLFAIAGQDENMVMCSVECYSVATNDWVMKSSIPHAVYNHASTVCQETVFTSGGQRFDGFSDQMFQYYPNTDKWVEKTSMFAARSNHIMETVNNDIFVLGGNVEDAYGFLVNRTVIERYRPGCDQWTVCMSTLNLREAGSCVLDSKIYIVGGIYNVEHYCHDYSKLLQTFDTQEDKLDQLEKLPCILGQACSILTLPQGL